MYNVKSRSLMNRVSDKEIKQKLIVLILDMRKNKQTDGPEDIHPQSHH